MLRGNGGIALEQKDINVNVFSAAPQTCSGEKVFNPNISSAAPQACAAKRAPTYSERLDKLRIFADEAAEELPQVFYRELNGGIILSPITKAHPQSDPKKPLLVLGEYKNSPQMGRSIVSTRKMNAGLIRNRGVELSLGGMPVSTKNWKWEMNFNIAKNSNKLVELANL